MISEGVPALRRLLVRTQKTAQAFLRVQQTRPATLGTQPDGSVSEEKCKSVESPIWQVASKAAFEISRARPAAGRAGAGFMRFGSGGTEVERGVNVTSPGTAGERTSLASTYLRQMRWEADIASRFSAEQPTMVPATYLPILKDARTLMVAAASLPRL